MTDSRPKSIPLHPPGRPAGEPSGAGRARRRSRLFDAEPDALLVDEWVPNIKLPPPPEEPLQEEAVAGPRLDEHGLPQEDAAPDTLERTGPARIYVGAGAPAGKTSLPPPPVTPREEARPPVRRAPREEARPLVPLAPEDAPEPDFAALELPDLKLPRLPPEETLDDDFSEEDPFFDTAEDVAVGRFQRDPEEDTDPSLRAAAEAAAREAAPPSLRATPSWTVDNPEQQATAAEQCRPFTLPQAPPPPRTYRRGWWVAAVLVLVGIGAIWWLGQRRGAELPPPTSGPAESGSPATLPVRALPPAVPGPGAAAAPPPAEATPPAPAPEVAPVAAPAPRPAAEPARASTGSRASSVREVRREAAPAREPAAAVAPPADFVPTTGMLSVDSDERAVFYIGNRRAGETPLPKQDLAPGRYTVRAVGLTTGRTRTLEVEVKAGETTKASFDFNR